CARSSADWEGSNVANLTGAYLSYPAVPGDKRFGFALITGPASYTVITTGTPPTGGILVNAGDFGLTELEWVGVGVSDNGQYHTIAFPALAQTQPQKQVRLEAITTATGAKVVATTDLSGRTFLLMGMGS